jgi:DNA repair exonuclease SbcCD ATPase subunit
MNSNSFSPLAGMLVVAVSLAIGGAACDLANDTEAVEDDGVEDLTIVVEADKTRIMEEERNLRERRQSMAAERERLEQERTEVSKQLASLSKQDKKQRQKLEAEARRLAEKDREVRDRNQSLEAERAKLDQDKSKLLERISKLTKTKGGLSIAQREELIGRREKELARREAELAEREKNVSLREAQTAKNLAELGETLQQVRSGGLARTVAVNAPSQSSRAGSGVSRGAVQRSQRQVRSNMGAKGILLEDLPPQARELSRAADAAYKSRDYTSSHEALTQLAKVIAGIVVNEGFVKAKMSRINRAYDDKAQKKLSAKKQQRVQALLAEVSESYSDGRFDRANRKINQIHSLLPKK